MNAFKLVTLLIFLTGPISSSIGEVRMPRIFSSNMVLQKGVENTLWGWADKNERISVSLNGKTVRTKARADGKWSLKLPAMDYGGPYVLLVRGKNTIEFTNVMIGEVWVCSGQSNMQFPVLQSINGQLEVNSADYNEIRLFRVPIIKAQTPQDDLSKGKWEVCSPTSIPGFSAVGYFFARYLYQNLKVPVGVIESAWGGTVAETWMSAQTIQNDPDFADKLKELGRIDLKAEEEQAKQRIKELVGDDIPKKDIGMAGDKPLWTAADLDESNWKSIQVPKVWEEQGYDNFNGIAYYRYTINLTEDQVKKDIKLHLGKVDDTDITWINGTEVGRTEHNSSVNRVYVIDSKLLKPGRNVLVVRVEDDGGKGGIYGAPDELFLMVGMEKISLSGQWKFRFGKPVIISDFSPNSYPTLLFNSMINPIIPYGIKGVIWYQGESNANRAIQYRRIFPDLITDWRKHWQLGDFPFIWVQLANYMKPVEQPSESSWAELREAQAMTLSLSCTGMASAIDIGEADDIHPKNKQDVGIRLGLAALKMAYARDILAQGPTFESMKIEGGAVRITYKDTGAGLVVRDQYGYINGFAVAGTDRKFYWAKASLMNDNTIIVSSEKVRSPVAVRYGWSDNPDDLNLYNTEGLPANPFRTDDWPRTSKE